MADDEWYWCLTHGEPELGKRCRAQDRMGPYPSMAAAEAWKDTHAAREDAWDEEDEEDQQGGGAG